MSIRGEPIYEKNVIKIMGYLEADKPTEEVAELTGYSSFKSNISQRDLFEAALIEFMQKYGFKIEVDLLLNS